MLLRIEAIKFSGREGKTEEECPIAKWILRRTNEEEKVMVVAKQRLGHRCDFTWTTVLIVQWEGLPRDMSDRAYKEIAEKTATYGIERKRRCGANRKKTCTCQGLNRDFTGASYTFGCSWSMYHNTCKFCRSSEPHKFRLKEDSAEEGLEDICLEMTNTVGDIYRNLAPASHANMCLFEEVASKCRIGDERKAGRPFSGITSVSDFCAHSHKDYSNMVGGATAIVTLLRPQDRELRKPEEEQYHVLPLYCPDMTNREVDEKVATGSLEVLDRFSRTIAVRDKKMAGCKRGRLTAAKKDYLDKLAKDHANLPTSMPKDGRTFTDPQIDGRGGEEDEVVDVDTTSSKSPQTISATYKSFSESWHFPRFVPQLDGKGEGSEKDAGIIGKFADLTIHQSLKETSLTYKTFSETWHFPKSMPQLDGQGGEGDDDATDSDATIHDLDEQADLRVNLNAEELKMEANDPAQSMEGVKIQVGI